MKWRKWFVKILDNGLQKLFMGASAQVQLLIEKKTLFAVENKVEVGSGRCYTNKLGPILRMRV
jgi:hypothetical protein